VADASDIYVFIPLWAFYFSQIRFTGRGDQVAAQIHHILGLKSLLSARFQ